MQKKFLALINKYEGYLEKDEQLYNIIGYVKVTLVLCTGLLGYFLVSRKFPLGLIVLFALALILLVGFWIYHAKIKERTDYSKGIIAICQRNMDRITGEWSAFQDIGSEFVDTDHAYGCDLDIAGKKSLFQFLNTTHTWHGRQAFARDLLHPSFQRDELLRRQEAVAELSRDIEFAGKSQFALSKTETGASTKKLTETLKDETTFIMNKAVKLILTCLPVLTLLLIVIGFVLQQKNMYIVGALMVAVQGLLWVVGVPRTLAYFGVMADLPPKLEAYTEVIRVLTGKTVTCHELKQIQDKTKAVTQAIGELSKIAYGISVKNNAILYFLVNTFLLWDYQCGFRLQEWKHKYAGLVEQWFCTVGEFESLLCLSHLPNICENTCLPTIHERGNAIEAKALGHPLLLNEKRVNNDFSFNDTIFIISGSNMSGKTTFLRTVGVNIVLARAGGFVCAAKMGLPILDIVTSMRIADDLNEGVSTFYAELKRIKTIIDCAQNQPGMIFLIDEIFKGTNSIDRLTGAKTVIEKLDNLGAVGLISTHDLELCELAGRHDRIKNYSFSERYEADKICFDYTLKPGKSNTTNAKYLMKMVGIVDSE
ncbi:MAG: DNA mismatch repair protein MutS [Gracilibacteraceae bacterium]|nr:DNA mismatch repair protein MutS [Gracilibacteraceae bacterium]